MSETKAIETKSEAGRQGRANYRKGNQKPNPAPNVARAPKTKFVGGCDELAECIFDCEDARNSRGFENAIDKLATTSAPSMSMVENSDMSSRT